MKRLIVLLIFLLFAHVASLEAQINGKRWFTEVTFGSGISHGSFEMNRFYDPTVCIAFDLGYMLTPRIGIVPVSLARNGFKFDKQGYIDNFWDYKDEYYRRLFEEIPEDPTIITTYPEFKVSSSLWGVAFMPGLVFFSPTYSGFRYFTQVGAGVYFTKLYMENFSTSEGKVWLIEYWRHRYWHKDSIIFLEERNVDFGMLFSAGMECDYEETVTFMCKLTYNLIFTKEKNEIPQISKLDGLWYFYLADNSLRFHRFLEEKNMWILEFKGGVKFYF